MAHILGASLGVTDVFLVKFRGFFLANIWCCHVPKMSKSILNLMVEEVFTFHFLVNFERLLSYFLVLQRAIYSTLVLCVKQSCFFSRGHGILKCSRVS